MQLKRLQQGPRSVNEYYKDLETTLTKMDKHDSEESKITRFVSGLREIQDIVELWVPFFGKLVHLVMEEALPPIHWKATKMSNWGNH